MRHSISEVIRYRGLIKQLAVRDLKLRYERSTLGFLWSLLNPLTMIAIYAFFFSVVVKMRVEHYPIFLVSALLPWNFVARGLLSVSLLPYQNGYLLNRAAFPAESLVFSGMIANLVDFCLEMTIFTLILVGFGMPLFPGVLALPLIMIALFTFTSGVALIFAVANIFYRDTQYVAGIIATAWLYLTPVFYPASLVPERFQFWYSLNPMVHLTSCFRKSLYDGALPDWTSLMITVLVSFGVLALGWTFFNKHKADFAELV
ncbi:MAG: ABC transporter permease [Armatimonadota bacterium]|nr:ABC transporter permease [Armatimonadota bacterium]